MAENRSHKLEVVGSTPTAPTEIIAFKHLPSIDKITFYWLAGLLEAEGSFMAATPSEHTNTIRVAIAMTDEDIIARVAATWGVGYRHIKRKNSLHKDYFYTVIRNRTAYEFMQVVRPLMSQRRQGQIDHALEKFQYKPNLLGENSSFAKLTNVQVLDIKRRLAAGEKPGAIAKDLGRAYRTILDIKLGKSWGHITLDEG